MNCGDAFKHLRGSAQSKRAPPARPGCKNSGRAGGGSDAPRTYWAEGARRPALDSLLHLSPRQPTGASARSQRCRPPSRLEHSGVLTFLGAGKSEPWRRAQPTYTLVPVLSVSSSETAGKFTPLWASVSLSMEHVFHRARIERLLHAGGF